MGGMGGMDRMDRIGRIGKMKGSPIDEFEANLHLLDHDLDSGLECLLERPDVRPGFSLMC